ncbi:type I restriction endonuclease subunit R [Burkholderia stabilis]|uniref:type I restriction endonuclease subunit R n=1 Tax=Burkholderia stabilis TaxID=95485 RepID=UPI000851FDB0|nr:DEAD/DEAH box helicase family protein [Burkholderia stabilis]AOR67751.1 type I restriction endonuclease subunit R [Burkholderia stabilis]HDR9492853.1 type I restriction endonuclease subunit R [Burkholderia stabilis]HDR9523363.1 type I restriction endonuclease subunit R [Burkholderia stabilis]HDR9530524.1 type I restriction endonuclease subunit R [Burkholderia stabilis]HDR9538045.1 type I restriction endonuclease subunit R [Burkholderia stabilis]
MSNLHQEHHFEAEICRSLAAKGWHYAEGDAAHYDRATALYLPDLETWIETTQSDTWQRLTRTHGPGLKQRLAERVRKSLNERGTLDVLRRGVEMLGLKEPLSLVQFKPALAINPVIQQHYAANRLRVVRQVRHSANYPQDALDLVLFVNGIPVATAELKSNFTQGVQDAVDQYRFDRHPHPKGGQEEPLLAFPGGALVHFAVSQTEVMMATRLAGPATHFLPFNRGNNGAAGNAHNPVGFATAYLWDEVWAPQSWLDILHRYLIGKRDEKKLLKSVIFPRHHQLEATRKLVDDVLARGPGQRYLIQHSAGSGKTNSIAWTAHFLADLHDADNRKLFDSVLVVSDRTVLDAQLQEAIFDFERTTGVVASITNESGSKSSQLGQALKDGKKIIVCTIQTFPAAMRAAQELAATEGKRFAVIADEAHSSQTGEAAAKLKQFLSAEEWADLQDGGEIDQLTLLGAQMEARAGSNGLTYVAFTATPKQKTLELFGRLDPDGLPQPFHVYSMRQAIEEGFILDVLKNYTTYKLAFRLAHEGQEYDEKQVERSSAMKGIMQWVRLHPYNIAQKVQIVVEHYRDNVQPLLDGKAKAMVVVASRKEAVRWQMAIRAYIEKRGYSLGVLVAFSGEIDDPDSFPAPVSETSKELNPGLKGRDIRDAFAEPDYHLLLVANKFQTGFDQPLLCGMYVDKMLGGIQTVQTLSRLNRAHPGKDTTYILDFVNDAGDVLKAFKTYYETAQLEATTDPHHVYDLRAKLDAAGYYDDFEVDRVTRVELDPKGTQAQLQAAIAPVADRLLKRYKTAQQDKVAAEGEHDEKVVQAAKDTLEALVLFKNDMGAFVRLYAFLSQIFDYGNTDIEKRFLFYKRLIPLLEFGRERDTVDLSKVTLTHHSLRNTGRQPLHLGHGEPPKLPPMDAVGSGAVQDKEKAFLDEIIQKVNGLFDGELTDDDQLVYVNGVLKGKLLENELLVQQAASNSKEQFANSPDLTDALMHAIIDAFDAHTTMSKQALDSARVRDGLKDILLGPAQLYEALRARSDVSPRRRGT